MAIFSCSVLGITIFVFSILAMLNAVNGYQVFNVEDYGAVGDGVTDDSHAFLKAWNQSCGAKTGFSVMFVPQGRSFLLNPISFYGPCNSKVVNIQVMGEILAPNTPKTWEGIDPTLWISFSNVHGLSIRGSGTFNGRGSGWWNQSCRYHPGKGCTSAAPTAIKLLSCNRTSVRDVKFVDGPQTHLLAFGCNSLCVNNVSISSPGDSPNTDGIHLQSTQHVRIRNSKFSTGDDCISIGDHTNDIVIDTINCGPGHGISIGSLGRDGSSVQVEDIHVSNVYFEGTTNGARIKTWQVGKGYARGITFKQLNFTNVQNPIIIDQNYCDVAGQCGSMTTGVHISNVSYQEAYGTSSTPAAISLNCSQAVPCTDIIFNSVHLGPVESGDEVLASCANVHGRAKGSVQPSIPCLSDQ